MKFEQTDRNFLKAKLQNLQQALNECYEALGENEVLIFAIRAVYLDAELKQIQKVTRKLASGMWPATTEGGG